MVFLEPLAPRDTMDVTEILGAMISAADEAQKLLQGVKK
jgi:hypothetical protein